VLGSVLVIVLVVLLITMLGVVLVVVHVFLGRSVLFSDINSFFLPLEGGRG
jgi:hypothetical protein